MSRRSVSRLAPAIAFALIALPNLSLANAIVRAIADKASIAIGETVSVELRADLSLPVVGFGLDLFPPSQLSVIGTPTIGPLWNAVAAPDGDGLAGLAPLTSIQGTDVLLATIVFQGASPGVATLVPGVTVGDLTEGFALNPLGFDTVQFEDAVIAVPEPGLGLILVFAVVALALKSFLGISARSQIGAQNRSAAHCPK